MNKIKEFFKKLVEKIKSFFNGFKGTSETISVEVATQVTPSAPTSPVEAPTPTATPSSGSITDKLFPVDQRGNAQDKGTPAPSKPVDPQNLISGQVLLVKFQAGVTQKFGYVQTRPGVPEITVNDGPGFDDSAHFQIDCEGQVAKGSAKYTQMFVNFSGVGRHDFSVVSDKDTTETIVFYDPPK